MSQGNSVQRKDSVQRYMQLLIFLLLATPYQSYSYTPTYPPTIGTEVQYKGEVIWKMSVLLKRTLEGEEKMGVAFQNWKKQIVGMETSVRAISTCAFSGFP